MNQLFKNSLMAVIFAASVATVSAENLILQPLLSFGTNGDGTIRPGDKPYLLVGGSNNPPHNRGMAYNPTTGNLLVVNKTVGAESVNILDSTNGNDVGTLTLPTFLEPWGNANF